MKQLLPTFVLGVIIFSLLSIMAIYSHEFKTNWYADSEAFIETSNGL